MQQSFLTPDKTTHEKAIVIKAVKEQTKWLKGWKGEPRNRSTYVTITSPMTGVSDVGNKNDNFSIEITGTIYTYVENINLDFYITLYKTKIINSWWFVHILVGEE